MTTLDELAITPAFKRLVKQLQEAELGDEHIAVILGRYTDLLSQKLNVFLAESNVITESEAQMLNFVSLENTEPAIDQLLQEKHQPSLAELRDKFSEELVAEFEAA